MYEDSKCKLNLVLGSFCMLLSGMLDVKSLIRFFDIGFVYRTFSLILLFCLIIIADIVTAIFISGIIGKYIYMAFIVTFSLAGFFLGIGTMSRISKKVKLEVTAGNSPQGEFKSFLGAFIATVLLVVPGVLSGIAGLVVMLPAVRKSLGERLLKNQASRMKELNEYLKLYDF